MRISVGTDLVQISRIAGSLDEFGARFAARILTEREAAYATTPGRVATRWAAKEAAKKALALDGVGWRDLEVVRAPDGACELVLHGAARAAAGARRVALSMSRDGDYATATVVAYGDVHE